MNHRDLYRALSEAREGVLESERRAASWLAGVCESQRASARNLVHYLALRAHDHRALQEQLAAHGFSSLGRSESHVLAQIDAVLSLLARLVGEPHEAADALAGSESEALLHEHASQLLGASPKQRRVRVMVTLPSEAAHDAEQVRALVAAGMDLARINAAHDDVAAWRAMARNVRTAARELGRTCLIAVDLAGPKCRTGALEPGPEVLKLKPERSAWGEVLQPARAWLVEEAREPSARPTLPVREAFLDRLNVGDKVKLRDARGRKRTFRVESIADGAVEIVGERTTYVRCGTRLHAAGDVCPVGHLPRAAQSLRLRCGDLLALTRSSEPGHPARVVEARGPSAREQTNGQQSHACIPCEPPELLDMLREGEAVWFDDGRIGGVAETVEAEQTLVRITRARPEGEKLRAGKGINLPDSEITLPAITREDREALAFAADQADLVEASFLRAPEDVRALQEALAELGKPELGVVLKIETRQGFARLPELLLAAMRRGTPGVMIARGDLAVECGFERLAEVQEEILWLCEAAHVPVVWATQVLESMAKRGQPTRAEITDAAMAERAECVMLNKGPQIVDALRVLDDVLRRMSAHQHKKMSTFRALAVAQNFAKATP